MFKMNRVLALVGTVAAVSVAQAEAIGVTALVTDIAAQGAPIALIGGAVLLIAVAVKAFKWVRSALS